MKIAYQSGSIAGTPKGDHRDCSEITDAVVLPNGYARVARRMADRRIILAAYRLAALLRSSVSLQSLESYSDDTFFTCKIAEPINRLAH